MLTEALAYPVLLLAVYGASWAGARPNPRLVTWGWALATAILVGIVVAVHVRLALAGFIRTPFQIAVTTTGLAGIFVLVGMHTLKAFEGWGASRPPPAESSSATR